MNDSPELMPSIAIPLAALRGVLTDVRYARKQIEGYDSNRMDRCNDALERVEAEIDGWLRLAGNESNGVSQ